MAVFVSLAPSMVIAGNLCPPDLDFDGDIDAEDLAGLLLAWGPNPGNPADLDFDGDVDAADLAQLLLKWGFCSGCCFPHLTGGCDNQACEDQVCGVDAFCCDTAWDELCVAQAIAVCGDLCPKQVENDHCEDALPIFDGDTDFDNIGATTDGPRHGGICKFDGQTYQDIWYDYTATCTGDLTVSTCDQADYDTDLVVYDGCDCPVSTVNLLGCNDDADNCFDFTSELTVPVVEGNCYKVRVGGFDVLDVGTGTITITCTP